MVIIEDQFVKLLISGRPPNENNTTAYVNAVAKKLAS